MPAVTCPSAAELRQLVDGQSSSQDIARLEEHVAGCASCLEALKKALAPHDTLNDLLPETSTLGESTQGEGGKNPVVEALMKRLEKLRPASQGAAPDMLSFACASCGKKLKVKAALAGKKVKCPGCGQATAVPAGDVSAADERTLAPREAPSSASATEAAQTLAPSDHSGSFEDMDTSDTPDAGPVWDFLAPAQKPDEIGRLGSYRVLKVLGHGGMGVVFKAEDPGLQRTIALKAMLPSVAASASAKKRFLREARAAAALKHDNVVTIHQVGEDRGAPFLAMEFLHGEPLDERLKRENVLPLAEVLKIGREVAEGLAAAHEQGLIHRDIKPGNVWLETRKSRGQSPESRDQSRESSAKEPRKTATPALDSGLSALDSFRVKILDFGLARAVGDQTNLTQSGAIVGTPAYMAPEQASGKSVDHRCDLFSLGAMLYRLSTGELPFKGSDTLAILSALAMDTPQPPLELNAELAPEVSDLIMRLLAKKPDERPASANEVAEALRELEAGAKAEKTAQIDRPVASSAAQKRRAVAAVKTAAASGKAAPATSKAPPRRKVAMLAGLLGLVAAAVVAGIIILRPAGGEVEFHVEVTDDSVAVALDKLGGITLIDRATKKTYKVEARKSLKLPGGDYDLIVTNEDGLEFSAREFSLKGKDAKAAVRVSFARLAKVGPPTAEPRGQFALEFDDPSKSVVTVPGLALDPSGPFTLEAAITWQPKTLPSAVYVGQSDGFYIGTQSYTHVRIGHPGGIMNAGGGFKIAPKVTRIALVYTGSEIIGFRDGKFVGRKELKVDQGAFKSPFEIAKGLVGRIAAVRVSSIARYDAPFDPTRPFVPDKDTIALYHCDEGEGDLLKDSSGNNHHGRIVGGKWVKADSTGISPIPNPPVAAGDAGLQFGQDQSVTVSSIKLDRLAPFTIEAYVTPSEDSFKGNTQVPVLSFGRQTQIYCKLASKEWAVGVTTDDKAWRYTASVPIAKDRRSHVAGVRTGKQLRFYVDGKVAQTIELPRNVSLAEPSLDLFKIGGGSFAGVIDEVRVSKVDRYDKDFTPAQRFEPDADTVALYHFDEGAGDVLKDSSGNGHHGKILGAKWVKADGTNPVTAPKVELAPANSYGLAFEGKADLVEAKIPAPPSRVCTLDAWVSLRGIGIGQRIMGREKTWLNINAGSCQFITKSALAGAAFPKDYKGDFHVAAVDDGNELRVYLNGKLIGSKLISSSATKAFNADDEAFTLGGLIFNGILSGVRLSKNARYAADFVPQRRWETDADTLVLYHFDEGQGDILKDSSGNGHHGKIIGAKWVKASSPSGSAAAGSRWPLAPSKAEDIAWLQGLKATVTVRTGPDKDVTLKPATPPAEPATIVGVQFDYGGGGPLVTDEVLARVATLTDLERLVCSFSKPAPSPASKNGLPQLTRLTNLRHLGLSRIGPKDTPPDFLGSFPALESLNLEYVAYPGWEAHVARLPNLGELRLYPMEGGDLDRLAAPKTLKTLTLEGYGTGFNKRLEAGKKFAEKAPWCRVRVLGGEKPIVIEPTAPLP